MNEFLIMAVALMTGLVLGGIFFGGLWWTVRECVVSQRSTLWLIGSWLLRMSIALMGFYFVGLEHWQRLLLCLLGFVVARLLVNWLIRLPVDQQSQQRPDVGHAP